MRNVRVQQFVYGGGKQQIPVTIEPMTQQDAEVKIARPLWQAPWISEYLADPQFAKYAAKVGDESIALGTYEILEKAPVVHIVYMEAQPEPPPTLDKNGPKYTEIGRLLAAYGIKLSMDN